MWWDPYPRQSEIPTQDLKSGTWKCEREPGAQSENVVPKNETVLASQVRPDCMVNPMESHSGAGGKEL